MSKRPRVPGTRRPRPPATIVDWIEANKPSGQPLVLSEPSKVWVDRMWHAFIRAPSGDVSEQTLDEMDAAFEVYLQGLADEEERDLTRFAFVSLLELLTNNWDGLPRCKDCRSFLCPHCGDLRRHRHAEKPAT